MSDSENQISYLPDLAEVDLYSMKAWYKSQARKNKIGFIINIVWCILATIITALTAQALIRNGKAEEYLRDRFNTSSTVVIDNPSVDIKNGEIVILLLSVSLLTFFYPFFIQRNRLKTISHVKLNREQFKHIWNIIDNLVEKMELDKYEISLYLLKNNSYEAHVSKTNNTVNLYISRNLVSYYSQDQDEFKAIIAHELGHVFQRDTRLLILSGKILVLPTILVLIAALYIYLTLGSNSLRFVGFFGLIIFTFSKIVIRRQKAENLADTASIIFLEKTSIISALQKFVSNNDSFWYPSKAERINFIETTLKKFKKI